MYHLSVFFIFVTASGSFCPSVNLLPFLCLIHFDSQVFQHPSWSVWVRQGTVLSASASSQPAGPPHRQRNWRCNTAPLGKRRRDQQERWRKDREWYRRKGGREERGSGDHRCTSRWGVAHDDHHNWKPATPPPLWQTKYRSRESKSATSSHLLALLVALPLAQPPSIWLALRHRTASSSPSSLPLKLPCRRFTFFHFSAPPQPRAQRQRASPRLQPPGPTNRQYLPTTAPPHPAYGSGVRQGWRERSSSGVQVPWARERVPQVLLTGKISRNSRNIPLY